ncbi:dna repair protein recn [hydrocarbon metagenome]|uniref:DNA repair protein RecN n=1 Tax=hydrocarbon metagenome TaxID=938273 RepID=A0A0W8FUS8_9ZZZZ
MLNELSIKNFAIIDELHVSFGNGLNIISGETGAGKSIIIGAVSLLLGDRATTEIIRSQADTATVEAVFDISANKPLRDKITDMGFPDEEDLIIRRIVSHTGKNKAFINGQTATLANLASISERLINICGQREHQVILNAENHINILDEFGGCLPERSDYEVIYDQYRQIRSQIEKLQDLSKSREEKTDLLKFQLKEIQDINPQPAEDTALADEKKVLVNFQKLSGWADRAYDLLYGEKDSAIVKLKEVQSQIKEIKKIDTGLKLADNDIDDSFITLQEAALTLRDYGKNLFFDAQRLALIDERLELLNRLKRKHGGSLENVLRRKQEIEEDLNKVSSIEEELEKLNREEEKIKDNLRQKALRLSEIRKQAAKKLQEAVNKEIHELNMPNASFHVNFNKFAADKSIELFEQTGGDEIEFYLEANKGEEAKPLNSIASGGELSRIILALKNVLSRTGSVASIVFDEVDNGIGGAVAEIVGRKLKSVSANHQIICITHLPQIACFGDNHLHVFKKVAKGRTSTFVQELDVEQKVEEISRMLGGVNVTETTRKHAREMIKESKTSKF